MLIPKGIIPAMVTPFTEEYKLNEPALRQMVNKFIDAGVHGLFGLGTNGEFFSLTGEEKIRIAEIVVDEVKGRVPVYIGAGGISTEETVRLTKKLEEIGVDAVSVITPYFLTFTQKELLDHYKTLADSTSLPIVLYNIPARTGNHLQAGTVKELSKLPNIVGIKDSSGSYDHILAYIQETDPETFSVLAGTDSLILSTLMAGGQGAIASTANVFPEEVVSIYSHWKQGELAKAEKAQRVLRSLRSAFALGTLPSVLKEVLNMIGVPAGPSRKPVGELSAEVKGQLEKMVQTYREQGFLKQA
ncbi:4-hydroxy-tetrahydrodipicolinate synthase [Paenibacillus hamazuiensis]|uniref:4-hydroxy-tetrahydrodipicolinate synthase n=1 Tax=Paenibacillus hamazuiensis TaxID=2936508 RepID=UPI0023DEF2FD|nr:4-hydroxy-tetrahydrodipicolinate synthase [Paenibacillus hamazuiensis]